MRIIPCSRRHLARVITVAELAVAGALLAAVGLALGAAADAGGMGRYGGAGDLNAARASAPRALSPRPVKRTSAALAARRRPPAAHAPRRRRPRRSGGLTEARTWRGCPTCRAASSRRRRRRRRRRRSRRSCGRCTPLSASTTVWATRRRRRRSCGCSALPVARAPRRRLSERRAAARCRPRRVARRRPQRALKGAALDASGVTRELLRADRRARRRRSPQTARRRLLVARAFRRRTGLCICGRRRRRRRRAAGWAGAVAVGAAPRLGKLLGCFVAQACAGTDALVFPLPLSRALLALLCDAPLTAADARPADPVLFRFRVDALLEPGGIADVAMVMCEESLTVADDDAATPLCDGGAARGPSTTSTNTPRASPSTHSSRRAAPPPPTSSAGSGRWSPSALRHAGVGAAELAALLHGDRSYRLTRGARTRRSSDPAGWATTRRRQPSTTSSAPSRRGRGDAARCSTLRRAAPAAPGGFARLAAVPLQLLGEEPWPPAGTCFNALQLGPVDGGAGPRRLLETSVGSGWGLAISNLMCVLRTRGGAARATAAASRRPARAASWRGAAWLQRQQCEPRCCRRRWTARFGASGQTSAVCWRPVELVHGAACGAGSPVGDAATSDGVLTELLPQLTEAVSAAVLESPLDNGWIAETGC